jgi:ElaB/YqjD/DUF883 family membrane-anchored ribosome-binding protein
MTDPLAPQTGSPGYTEPAGVAPTTTSTTSTTTSSMPETSGSSTTDVAKSEGRRVAGDAAEGGKHVAKVAAHEASSVAGEARDQARSLLSQASVELSSQASTQMDHLASWLRQLADELRSMAQSTTGSEGSHVATGIAERGADLAQQAAGWLGDHEPRAVFDEVGSFARRRPGTFLLVAAGAGLLVGRLTRGLAAGSDDEGDQAQQRRLVTPDIPVAGTYGNTYGNTSGNTSGNTYVTNGDAAADSWAGGPAVEDQWDTPASGTAVTSAERVAPYREGEP